MPNIRCKVEKNLLAGTLAVRHTLSGKLLPARQNSSIAGQLKESGREGAPKGAPEAHILRRSAAFGVYIGMFGRMAAAARYGSGLQPLEEADMSTAGIGEEIRKRAEEIFDRMIVWRRDFHQHPELGNQEVRTAKIVADHLKAVGVDEVYTGMGESTGVLGIIRGAKPGPMVGLREDMDALAMKEETGLPFASTDMQEYGNKGMVPVMHACGHDCHTAMLMAAAEILAGMKDRLEGSVALIFQPAEEGCSTSWTKRTGGDAFVSDLVYREKAQLDASICLHILPGGKAGSAGMIHTRPGTVSYNSMIFSAKITGRGGHGYSPWVTVDPVVIGAQAVLAIQTIISRNVNPYTNHATISIGAFKGGDMYNVIPDEVVFDGAVRFTDESQAEYLKKRLEDTVTHVAEAGGAKAEIRWIYYPALHNDEKLIARMLPKFRALLGKDKATDEDLGIVYPVDDYSYFQSQAPGIWWFLSVAPDREEEGEVRPGLHTAKMMVNERGLLDGVIALAGFPFLYGKQ